MVFFFPVIIRNLLSKRSSSILTSVKLDDEPKILIFELSYPQDSKKFPYVCFLSKLSSNLAVQKDDQT
jgi:hypothetical protein